MLFNIVDSDFNNYQIISSKTYNNYNNYNNTNLECYICLESDDREKIIKMNNIYTYSKKCKCNLHVHFSCLECWYKKNMNCPICKTKVVNIFSLYNINIYSCKQNAYIILIRILIYILFIFLYINYLIIIIYYCQKRILFGKDIEI
jgi:hypothetical protein